ncbi:MAG: dipeptidase [Cellvibrionaceae bacterium]|nr:dipeptidase [Cellvibrionaceae bacterium]MCV6626288.1 dipeptidase [Cellvibrionaceae bacterium]
MKWIWRSLLLLVVLAVGVRIFVPPMIEKSLNRYVGPQQWQISERAQKLHDTLVVGDWHSDSTTWDRDLSQEANYGHVDFPRLQAGNVAMQMFTTVTKSPAGQNYHRNSADARDNITMVVLAQGWPPRTWNSLTERALYQAERLNKAIVKNPEQAMFVRTVADLDQVMAKRKQGHKTIAALIGTEGSHALDGQLSNVGRLYDAGFRMMSLQHFFDNKLGGSLHGTSGAGLTEFGRQVVAEIERRKIILDLSHSSEQVVRDVLAIATRPMVVSHTGLHGHCKGPRNISDKLMQSIAAKGGLIGVGYWDGALCGDESPKNVVKAIRYGIDLVGLEHIALGSDYDGAVAVQFDTADLAVLTDEMLKAEFSEAEIRAVMGENMLRFLRENLPAE